MLLKEDRMIVRFANHDDVDKLIKVRFDYFTADNYELTDEMIKRINSQLAEYYEKHLNKDFFAALVEDEGRLAATAFLVISDMPANTLCPTGRYGKVLNVLTYEEYRRKGYATAAMKMLIEEAKRQNLSYIELSASEMGKGVYKKLGFQETGSRYQPMKLILL